MRIRRMWPGDLAGVAAVYRARGAVSAGPLARDRKHWRRLRSNKASRGLWWVAKDRGRIVGYACGFVEDAAGFGLEVVWVPTLDGTDVPSLLVDRIFRVFRRRTPIARAIWFMAGSPVAPFVRARMPPPRPPSSVFMAAVTNERALVRDALEILRRRKVQGLALRVGAARGKTSGRTTAVMTANPNVLLGLLFGIRQIDDELRTARVGVRPNTAESRALLRAAFPPRRFWIQDAW